MGVRKSERCKFIPLAVILVFVPTEYDIIAREVGVSVEARDRTRRMKAGTDGFIDRLVGLVGWDRGRGVQFNESA